MCALGEIEGGRRGQVKDHPTRGDLKAGVRFHEIGLSATRVHAHADTCAGTCCTVGEPQTKALLIQTALTFLTVKIPGLLSDRGAGVIFYHNPREVCMFFKILAAEALNFSVAAHLGGALLQRCSLFKTPQ